MSLKLGPHKVTILLLLWFMSIGSYGQDQTLDSLKKVVAALQDSRKKVDVLLEITQIYFNRSLTDAIAYATHAKDIASKINYDEGLANSYRFLGVFYRRKGDFPEALDAYAASLEFFRKMNDLAGQSRILSNLGNLYADQTLERGSKAGKLGTMAEGQETKALEYYLQALKLGEQAKDSLRIVTALANIGNVYLNNLNTYHKALEYFLRALPVAEQLKDSEIIGTVTVNIGEVYMSKNNYDSALIYLRQSLIAFEPTGYVCYTLNDIAKVFQKQQKFDSALIYHSRALTIADSLGSKEDIVGSLLGIAQTHQSEGKIKDAITAYQKAEDVAKSLDTKFQLKEMYQGLASAYSSLKDYSNAFKYQTLLLDVKDTIYRRETEQKLARLDFTFEVEKRQDKLLKESDLRRQKIARIAFIGGLLLALTIAVMLYSGYRRKVRTNKILDQQLEDLRSAQAQLIQSEKMASLGQLTAGIAHEIQNPLNFVNNFSEVNAELIEELRQNAEKGDLNEIISITQELKENEQKISQHGRRADAIVKGMLQHSRIKSGQKEATDVNSLSDEYLRLAYQGHRAKDQSFSVKTETRFDNTVEKINVVPQDIGRVILNLINNALYAVTDKKKQMGDSFEPMVTVSTKRKNGKIEIRISDNGLGIPQKIMDKIFQPFFTTKPTGHGTGLGLSLAYDIVKAHGGEITFETSEGEGSVFVIKLPT